ncbi:PREDICTED: uncharacterized protein LOC109581555 [Amphimedon queenslandica]|uniref:Uncharacterized protein n=1 Tax=Amphimedon queenslandica TaxID=400682 RepID=A0A1X7V0Y2_AMPQE|nr:PREDICTED: uncharacterized protein LOC109581555 [Amphimedon queenslandica]|eukprot:XP_019851339.1 PREDICTED: uncharacterized protein LOC109581555 [Amphimedon queenslandica]
MNILRIVKRKRLLLVLVLISVLLFIGGIKFQNVPSYLSKVHVGGKVNEFFYNLLHKDHCPNTLLPMKTDLLIIGGMSQIGSRLAYHHVSDKSLGNVSLLVTEDILNVNRVGIKWYRWTKLNALGLTCSVYSYDSVQSMSNILNKHQPRKIVYIPTGLYDVDKDEKIWTSTSYYKLITNTLSIIEAIKVRNGVSLVIVSPKIKDTNNSSSNISGRWSVVFKTIIKRFIAISSIHNIKVFTTDPVLYGPWQDSSQIGDTNEINYVDNIVSRLMSILYEDRVSLTLTQIKSIEITNRWISDFKREQESMNVKDVVSGATLMFSYCYHCFFFSNNMDYIEDWFLSAVKYDLNVLLIHNTFNSDLESKLKLAHNRTEFLKADCVNTKAATDQRFYILYEYLLTHPEIKRIVFTDQRDVRFLNDPFHIMNGISNDMLYVGSDDDRCINSIDDGFIKKQLKSCFPGYSKRRELLGLSGCFNSGVLGGSRITMLTLLSHMMLIFESTDYRVCDMISLSIPAHGPLYDIVFTLYPFNSGFDSKTEGPFGLAIKHKISMY